MRALMNVSITIAVILLVDICLLTGVEAEDCWQIFNDRDPATNHMNRGFCELERKNLNSALAEFQFITRHEDTGLKPVAYLNIGAINVMQGNMDLAVKNYLTAIQLKPDYAEAYFNLGAVYYQQNLLKQAEKEFLKAIEIQPDYGRAHYSLGFVYLDQKKYDLAKKQAEKALEYGVPYTTLKEKLAKVSR